MWHLKKELTDSRIQLKNIMLQDLFIFTSSLDLGVWKINYK